MRFGLVLVAFFLAAVAIDAALWMIAGRILLPAMNLGVPTYEQWFWATVFIGIAAALGTAIKSVLDKKF